MVRISSNNALLSILFKFTYNLVTLFLKQIYFSNVALNLNNLRENYRQ